MQPPRVPPPRQDPPKKTKLTPVGDGLGVVIDKELLDKLRISTDTTLEISHDGYGITIEIEGRKRPPEPRPPRRFPTPRPVPPAPRKPEVRLPKKPPW